MPNNIDERVVEMRFDNAQFERGVGQSIKSLESLKSSMNFSNTAKNFDIIETYAKNVSLEPIANAVDNIAGKFNWMHSIALMAMNNIVTTAMNAGRSMIKSLTTDQISAGFSKYNDKVSSVQTIMAATGETIDVVNDKLSKLMWFTDETSYDFVEMVGSIGKFTSAGVKLDTAIDSMMGIANWAAISGAGIQNANRAMYNLSQAIGTGALLTKDWMSIENANMATKEFKEVLIDAGVQMGTLQKNADGTIKTLNGTEVTFANLRETLSSKWATSDVLTTALTKYGEFANEVYAEVERSGDTTSEVIARLGNGLSTIGVRSLKAAQEAKTFAEAIGSIRDAVSSNIMMIFETIIGDYEEARKLWTAVANTGWDVFVSDLADFNEVLAQWKDEGGRDLLIDSIADAWAGFASIASTVRSVLDDIFPEVTAERLLSFTQNLHDLAEEFKNRFAPAIPDLVIDEFSEEIDRNKRKLIDFSEETVNARNNLSSIKGAFKRATSWIQPLIKVVSDVASVFRPMTKLVSAAARALLDFSVKIGDSFGKALNKMVESDRYTNFITTLTDKVSKAVDFILTFNSRMSSAFSKLKPAGESMIQGLLDIMDSVVEKIEETLNLDKIDFSKFTLSAIFKRIIDTNGVGEGNSLSAIFGTVLEKLGSGLSWLASFLKDLKLEDILKAVESAFLIILSLNIKQIGEKVAELLDTIIEIPKKLSGATKEIKDIGKITGSLKTFAIEIAVIALSLAIIGSIDTERLLGAISIMLIVMKTWPMFVKALASSTKGTDIKSFTKLASSLIPLAFAMILISTAMRILGKMDSKELIAAVAGLSGILFALAKFSGGISSLKIDRSIGKSLLKIAAALAIMMIPIKVLSGLNISEWGKGLGGLAVMLAEILAFSKLMTGVKFSPGVAAALLGISVAFLLMLVPIKVFSSMNWNEFAIGLTGLGILLAEIALFSAAITKTKVNPLAAASVLIIAGAVTVLAMAVKLLSTISFDNMAVGLLGLASVLAIVVIAAQSMKGLISGAAGMLAASSAILILAVSLTMLGQLKLSQVGVALLAVAGALLILGAAAFILGPVAPSLIVISGALALLGVAIALISVGFATFAASIPVFAASIAGTIGTILLSLQMLLTGIVRFIPDVISLLTTAIVDIVKALATNVPGLVSAVLQLLVNIIESLTAGAQDLVNAITDLIISLADAIGQNADKLVNAGVKLIVDFINGIADGIRENSEAIFGAIKNLISAIIEFIITGIQSIVKMIPAVGDEWAEKLEGVKEQVRASMTDATLSDTGKEAGAALAEGLGESSEEVQDAGVSLGGTASDGVESTIPDFKVAGSDAVLGFVGGLSDSAGLNNAFSAGSDLGLSALAGLRTSLDEHSPSKESEQAGYFFDIGFIRAIWEHVQSANEAGSELGSAAFSGLSDSLREMNSLTTSTDLNLSPTISPVYDLDAMRTAAALAGSLNTTGSYNIAATMDYGLKQMQDMQLLIGIATDILHSVQNGSDLYLDDDVLAGRINRRLGQT